MEEVGLVVVDFVCAFGEELVFCLLLGVRGVVS